MSGRGVAAMVLACAWGLGPGGGSAAAQPDVPGKVAIAFNRYYTVPELHAHVRAIAAAYPELVRVEVLGESLRGREMLLAIVNNPATGPHDSKPAMWIDGNIHGNEIQASEVVLYTLWYLSKAAGRVPEIDRLLERYSFYLLVSLNPDGRDNWFENPNTSSSSRSNSRPVDDDRDGRFDEDGPDDLDGDGSVTQMWRPDPNGDWVRSQTDPRVFVRVKPGERGTWAWAGSEGIDNDGDGRINEDGRGGDDMNRNWPSDWRPDYVQFGAGPYPLSAPETRAVADWIFAHDNIAAVQSYHNAGGMILRGPGVEQRQDAYRGDLRVYDEIAQTGEKLLPYYRYLQTWKDLYPVHGGLVNWTFESLGIISFTNEMWTNAKYFQREAGEPDDESMWLLRDKVQFGQVFKDYAPFAHPEYGEVLIGGPNKWSSRATPTFLLEEECHRNFAFTMLHAGEMPVLRFDRVEVEALGPRAGGGMEGGGLWQVTLSVRNDRLIPTRTARAREVRSGRSDLLTVEGAPPGAATVLAAGRLGGWFDHQMEEVRFEPARVQVPEGIPGRGERVFRFIIAGARGARVNVAYDALKAARIVREVVLEEAPAPERGD
ncbi:MAG TPA: M14 family metallopeptidase [Phycisphaerales bacterium]|nr:M14 family metallopeptidase [Phycisphaerales bacterium]